MCIGVPMVIQTVRGAMATCVARGCSREVSLLLLDEGSAEQGAHVLVHQNLAMEIITEEHARLVWEALDTVFASAPVAAEEATISISEEGAC
jgi:hydrogenase expression/formation protein HypC